MAASICYLREYFTCECKTCYINCFQEENEDAIKDPVIVTVLQLYPQSFILIECKLLEPRSVSLRLLVHQQVKHLIKYSCMTEEDK